MLAYWERLGVGRSPVDGSVAPGATVPERRYQRVSSTQSRSLPEGIVNTFVDVGRYWEVIAFEPEAVFGSGEYAAMFGRFTYRSRVPPALVACMKRSEPPRIAGRYVRLEGNWRQDHRGEWNPSQTLPFTAKQIPFG